MAEIINVGDMVISLVGRDKGKNYLVVDIKDGLCYIVDGKTRKVGFSKKKNLKHVKLVLAQADIGLADKIRKGTPTSDVKVRKRIKELSEKL